MTEGISCKYKCFYIWVGQIVPIKDWPGGKIYDDEVLIHAGPPAAIIAVRAGG